jgi:hypothetical protein
MTPPSASTSEQRIRRGDRGSGIDEVIIEHRAVAREHLAGATLQIRAIGDEATFDLGL